MSTHLKSATEQNISLNDSIFQLNVVIYSTYSVPLSAIETSSWLSVADSWEGAGGTGDTRTDGGNLLFLSVKHHNIRAGPFTRRAQSILQ